MIASHLGSFAIDAYGPQEARRLFPVVAFGAFLGDVRGSIIAGKLVDRIGV